MLLVGDKSNQENLDLIYWTCGHMLVSDVTSGFISFDSRKKQSDVTLVGMVHCELGEIKQ